jgi:gluconate kinase
VTDSRTWRLGTHYGIHVYAETPAEDDDQPVLTALDPAYAEQVVEDHNHVLTCNDPQNISYLLRLGRERDELMIEVESLRRRNEALEERGLKQAGHLMKANADLLNLRTGLAALLNPQSVRTLETTNAEPVATVDEADCA